MSKPITIKILGDSSNFDRAIAGVSAKTSALGKQMQTAGLMIGAAFAAAGAGVAIGLFKVGESLEEMQNTIRLGTGATGDALDDLVSSAESIATTVPASFEEVGTAIADVNTRTGLTGDALETLTTQMLNLADVTGQDVGSTIADTTRVFGDWSVAAEDSAEVVDMLWQASQATGIGVDELSQSLVTSGATLRGYGFDLEESTALLADWEQQGVNTEAMIAGMKAGMARFADAGRDPAEALDETITAIENATSEQEKLNIATEAFGTRAAPDMVDAINNGRFEVGELEAALAGSSETVNDAAEDTRTFGDRWQMFTNKIGVAVAPVATKMMDALEGLMEVVGDLADKWLPKAQAIWDEVIDTAMAFYDEVKPIIDKVMPALNDVWQKFTKNGEDMVPVLAAIGGVLAALIVPAMLSLAVSVVTALAPVILVTAAIAALVGGLVYAYRNFEGFRNVVDGVVRWFMNTALPALKQFGSGLVKLFQSAFAAVKAVIETVVGVIMAIWNGWGDDLLGGLKRTFDAIWDVLNGYVKILTGIFDFIKAIFTGKWGEAWDAVLQILDGALEVIWGVLRGIGNSITNILTGIRTVISAAFRTAWNMAKTAVSEGWDKVKAFFTAVPGQLRGIASSWWNAGKDMGKKIISGIISGLKAAGGFVSDVGRAIRNAMYDAINAVGRQANRIIPDSIPLPFGRSIGLPNPFPEHLGGRVMGGPVSTAGMYDVGERGREQVFLPKGSHVRAAHEAGGTGGNVYVDVQSNADPHAVGNAVAWALRTSGR